LAWRVETELSVGQADRGVHLDQAPPAVLVPNDSGDPDRRRFPVGEGDQRPVLEPPEDALAVSAGDPACTLRAPTSRV